MTKLPLDLERYRAWEAPPFLIAEAGVNHEGDVGLALRLVELAATAGVDAIKFQTYKAERIASRQSAAYWDRTLEPCDNQFELFRRYDQLARDDYQRLAEACAAKGLHFLSTPFDVDCVDWLDPLVPAFKIASADITNVPLLRRVAATGRPVLLSTGASTISEIETAVAWLRQHGCPQVAVLHCTLAYPTQRGDAHIGALVHLRAAFPMHPLGYSDHTLPSDSFMAIQAAFALGARIFEKHFTFDKSRSGNDHYHAFDADDFRRLRDELARLRDILGVPQKSVLPCEQASRTHARRSLVARQLIPKGTRLDPALIDVKRPGTGIEARYLDDVIGLIAACDIAEDEVLQWHMLARA
jgi:N-acetylneuraminate synthase